MVVKFPSSSEGNMGDESSRGEVEEQEHLAPVTPLRRATPARGRDGDDHPSRRGGLRPVAELPDGGGWNNTWGAETGNAKRASVTGRSTTGASAISASPTPFAAAEDAPDEESVRQARKTNGVAIRQLARRGMSRWELEQLLNKREIDPEVYRPELDRLETLGVIDDASLAATLAFTQHSRKGLGRTAIEQELNRRHIDPELIEAALADIGDEDELDRATELAVKRIGQLSSYDDETVRRRLHGFLARKGYSSSVIRQAMDAAFTGRRSRGGSGVRFQ